MAVKEVVSTVDIGSSKVTVCVAGRESEADLKVLGLATVNCSSANGGGFQSYEEAGDALRSAVAEVKSQSGVSVSSAYFGVSTTGNEVNDKHDSVVLDKQNSITITEHELLLAVRQAGQIGSETTRKVLHVLPRHYSLDGNNVRNPLGMHSRELGITSRVVVCPKETAEATTKAARSGGVEVVQLVSGIVASASCCLTEEEADGGVLQIDIGSGTTDIAVFAEGVPLHIDSLPVAGFQLSNDLSLGYGISFADAERLKIEHGGLGSQRGDGVNSIEIHPQSAESVKISRKEITDVMRARLQEIFSLVSYKLDQLALKEPRLSQVVLSGGGAQMQGIETVAKATLQRSIRVAHPVGIDSGGYKLTPADAVAVGAVVWATKNRSGFSATGNQAPRGVEVETRSKQKRGLKALFSRFTGR